MSDILLGTCGWSYAEWDGILYPQKSSKLKQYSSIFPTVEIDSTFYAMPKQETVLGWVRNTPLNFTFSAKLPQTITHKKTLRIGEGIESDLNQFCEVMRPLMEAGKLACILVQLPPFLRSDIGRLKSFLSILPNKPSFAVEFRHNSWLRDETYRLLAKYGVAYTIVDEPLLPPEVHVTSDTAYVRWHGRGSRPWFNYRYSEAELQGWVRKVTEAAGKAKKVLGYFNNHFHGYAPENCLQIMQMFGIVTSHSTAALSRVTAYRKGKMRSETQTLETWVGPITEKAVERLLLRFVDPEIMEKGRSIPDQDLSLREDSKRRLAAYIGDTTVDVDLEKRILMHYCPVWSRSSPEKRFCPHIAKLFLSIRPERARNILSLIGSASNQWKFESRLTVDFPT